MSFSLDTRHTKYLPNYAAALAHHDSIKPIRNSNCRPIAERRKQHFNIRTQTNALTDKTSIIVRLHATDIVTYTPDNRVTLNMGRHNTVSTRAAIHAVTGVSITQQYGCSWVKDRDGKHYLFSSGMELQTGDYYYDHKIIDPLYPDIHKLNRKAMNQKLHQFKNFYNYMLGVAKVDGFRGQTLIADSLRAMTNPDNYVDGVFAPEPETAFALACDIMARSEFGGRETYWQFFATHSKQVDPSSVDNKISTALKRAIIKLHKDTLLIKTKVTNGNMTKDPYQWAM
jgi:hypothetical protein